jgi:death-on-curing protein
MTRFLTLEEVIELHRLVIGQSGGASGIRDRAGLASAVAQPRVTFDGRDLYPTLVEQAAAIGFSLVSNHPFVDGNKRIGHAAMETFLLLNGLELVATVDEQETVVLGLAGGGLKRDAFTEWVRSHVRKVT